MVKTSVTYDQLQKGGPVRRPGQYYIRTSKWGPVICKWPRPRIGPETPANFYKQAEFGLACEAASNPCPEDFECAIVMARGTAMLPRDFLTAAAYGTILQPINEDGTPWVSYRSVTVNAQLVLDQVTDEVGEMIWRSSNGWFGVPIGSNGQILINDFGTPKWATYLPPGEAQPVMFPPNGYLNGVGTSVALNSFTGAPVALEAGAQINALAVRANAASATTKIIPSIYENRPGIGNPLVAVGPQVTGIVNGWNIFPLTPPVPIIRTADYFCMLTVTVAAFTQVNCNATSLGITATFSGTPPANLPFASSGTDNTRARVYALKV